MVLPAADNDGPAVVIARQTSRRAVPSHRLGPMTAAVSGRPRGNRCGCATESGTGVVDTVAVHLPGRVSPPPGVRRDLLALHEEGVGGEHGAVAHRHAVVDEGADPEGAAGADRDVVGLEGAVLLRVALDLAAGVERDVVADGDEGPLRSGSSRRRRPCGRAGRPAAARSRS